MIGKGMETLRTQIFTEKYGARRNSRHDWLNNFRFHFFFATKWSNTTKSQAAIQVAILITDGRQQDNTLARQASLAKEENIKIFTIGIGNRKHGPLFVSDIQSSTAGRV